MDGIVDELLQLEKAKHKALIAFDSADYENSVRRQTDLLAHRPLSVAASGGTEKLLVFSKLASLNTILYRNLLAITPSAAAAPPRYAGNGQVQTLASRMFSASA